MGVHETIGKSDEWYTPKYIFEMLGCTFDMDVASPTDRTLTEVPAKIYISENSIASKWEGFIWMNPPFGGLNGITPWMDKFIKHGNGIALTPDRTSSKWWQNAANKTEAVLFVGKRVHFVTADTTKKNISPTGTALFGIGELALEALECAQKQGLGILFKRK